MLQKNKMLFYIVKIIFETLENFCIQKDHKCLIQWEIFETAKSKKEKNETVEKRLG